MRYLRFRAVKSLESSVSITKFTIPCISSFFSVEDSLYAVSQDLYVEFVIIPLPLTHSLSLSLSVEDSVYAVSQDSYVEFVTIPLPLNHSLSLSLSVEDSLYAVSQDSCCPPAPPSASCCLGVVSVYIHMHTFGNILQYTATHCNTRQHTATHCNTL